MREVKKPYCRIEWNDFCELDYGYTICTFDEMKAQLDAFEFALDATEESTPIDERPSFEVTVVFLTEKEYGDEIDTYER